MRKVAEFCEHCNEHRFHKLFKCLDELLTCQEVLCLHAVSSLVSCCNPNVHLTYF